MYKLIRSLEQPGQGNAGVVQLSRAVFWSFFGVRKNRALNEDALRISPMQVIVAGVVGCIFVVLGFAGLVSLIVN